MRSSSLQHESIVTASAFAHQRLDILPAKERCCPVALDLECQGCQAIPFPLALDFGPRCCARR